MRQLTGPNDKVLGKHIRQDTGSLSITAEADGRHEYCFSNQMSAIADKIVRYAQPSQYLFPAVNQFYTVLTCMVSFISMKTVRSTTL